MDHVINNRTVLEGKMFKLSFKRPRNYFSLDKSNQYAIDRRIGILDWNGGCDHETNVNKCTICRGRYLYHYSDQ